MSDEAPSRLIAFDAVGTLIHPAQSVAATYVEVAAAFGIVREIDAVGLRFRAALRESHPSAPFDSPRWATNEAQERETWRTIVAHVLQIEGDIADRVFESLWRHFSLPGSWRLYEDAFECLERLVASKTAWIIASNFDGRLHEICRPNPLLSQARGVFPSSEVGWRKPSRCFFQRVAASMNVQPAELLMIGDDPVADVDGAIAADSRALLLDRGASASSASLTTLANLTDHIRRL